MKAFPLVAVFCCAFPPSVPAQQAVPHSPAIWREVSGVVFANPATLSGAQFTHPHMPAFRTSADGRIGAVVEGGGAVGETPAFTLFMPEKMAQPFLLNPAGSFTMTRSTPAAADLSRLNVVNGFAPAPLSNARLHFTDGVKGIGHIGLWDDGDNPQVVMNGSAAEDVYNLKVLVTGNSGATYATRRTQIFVTPIKITVANPKTTGAYIRLVEKTGPTVAGPEFPFHASGFEPTIAGDGRLLVLRIGSQALPWTNPNTGAAGPTSGHYSDIVYSYYPTGAAADPTKWTNLIPVSFAPFDNRINARFGFAMAPFRDAAGTSIPAGEDLGATYPWIDRLAKNLFFTIIGDTLHYFANGTWNNGRYPQIPNTNEPADYAQGEDASKHRGVSVLGLWTHGKMVLLDNRNNATDYAVGQGDTNTAGGTSTGPQHRLVTLFQPNTGPLGTENGRLLLGYGRATKRMPPGENDNGNIIDSIENLFNYRKQAIPLTRRDVVWHLSNSQQADEVVFDDYVDPDAFIIASMAGATTFPANPGSSTGINTITHHTGWNAATNTFSLTAVKLQNAATATPDRWIVPAYGEVTGPGRIEPAATGGVHGKGFSMNGDIGIRFAIPAQPAGVDVILHDWYVGLFVDCRFADDTTSRRLLTFPDGTAIQLRGRNQILYLDSSGEPIHRFNLPAPIAGSHPLDDLLPQRGWAHLAFQVRRQNTAVDFYLNGLLYNRWEDAYSTLFELITGNLTVGKLAGNSTAGFVGWIDDFKVIARQLDFETICNHANGSLLGLPSGYSGEWKTKFADRYPSWAHEEISSFLRNNGETSHPYYANHYYYRADHWAHRDSIPAGTVSLRQNIHFPEGPLFLDRPRPDSTTNTFCISCHVPNAKPGLDLNALALNSVITARNDPRRQPMQPPARVFGRIPAGLIDTTATPQPTTATSLPAGGRLIDEWMLPAFNNSATVQTFTVVDATTRRDLMTLAPGAVIDPARLGSANLTLRANLSTAQGYVDLQLDSGPVRRKNKPPYTAFGSDSSPWTGQVLSPGAHTIKASPQFGSLSQVSFTVAGNSTRTVASYRADFRTHAPLPGWNYLWNAAGAVSNPAHYRSLAWHHAGARYTPQGLAAPDNTVADAPWLTLHETGGHPGRGVNQSASHDRFAIAAYTVKLSGYYGVGGGYVTMPGTTSNGGRLVIYVEKNGATGLPDLDAAIPGAGTYNFSRNVGQLQPGDTIYVGVGPNAHDGADAFTHDFNIVFRENANPL